MAWAVRPTEEKTGKFKLDRALTYETCVQGRLEVVRILKPKFDRTSIISWGTQPWDHMRRLVSTAPKKVGVKKRAESSPGELLDFAGVRYLPISHPSMPNQVDEHLRLGFRNLQLGRPEFDRRRQA